MNFLRLPPATACGTIGTNRDKAGANVKTWQCVVFGVVSLMMAASGLRASPQPAGAGWPAPLAAPKALHVVYLMADTVDTGRPTIPAEYWGAGPNRARWTWNGRYPTTITTDGKTWTELIEPPNAASPVKVDERSAAASPAPTQPSLLVERAHSWSEDAPGVYGPGVLAGEIPFLGFGQPGKVYRGKDMKTVPTASGWEERGRVPYGYGADSATGKASLVEAVLTFDRQGRLTRFRRRRSGDIWENRDFSDFVRAGGSDVPRLVRYTQTDEGGGRVVTDIATTYRVQSLDTRPVPLDWFTMQHPPAGTSVSDYRLANHTPTLGLSGMDSSGVLYRYSGRATLDEESRAQYRLRRAAAGVTLH